jgi:hypothetical protein
VEYWLVTTGLDGPPGINGGIMGHQDAAPRAVNPITVPSVNGSAEKAARHDGKLVAGKMASASGGYQACFLDSEENFLSIHQFDASAKQVSRLIAARAGLGARYRADRIRSAAVFVVGSQCFRSTLETNNCQRG